MNIEDYEDELMDKMIKSIDGLYKLKFSKCKNVDALEMKRKALEKVVDITQKELQRIEKRLKDERREDKNDRPRIKRD